VCLTSFGQLLPRDTSLFLSPPVTSDHHSPSSIKSVREEKERQQAWLAIMTFHNNRLMRHNNKNSYDNSSEHPIRLSSSSALKVNIHNFRRQQSFRTIMKSSQSKWKLQFIFVTVFAVVTTLKESCSSLLEIFSRSQRLEVVFQRRVRTLMTTFVLLVLVVQQVQSFTIPSINQSRASIAATTATRSTKWFGSRMTALSPPYSVLTDLPSSSLSSDGSSLPEATTLLDDTWTMKFRNPTSSTSLLMDRQSLGTHHSSVSSIVRSIRSISAAQPKQQQRSRRQSQRRRGILGFDVFELNLSRRQDHPPKHRERLDSTTEFDDDDEGETFLSSSNFPHPGIDTFREDHVRDDEDFFPSPGFITWSKLPLSTPRNSLHNNARSKGGRTLSPATTTTTTISVIGVTGLVSMDPHQVSNSIPESHRIKRSVFSEGIAQGTYIHTYHMYTKLPCFVCNSDHVVMIIKLIINPVHSPLFPRVPFSPPDWK
jgi:hypothetical protein